MLTEYGLVPVDDPSIHTYDRAWREEASVRKRKAGSGDDAFEW